MNPRLLPPSYFMLAVGAMVLLHFVFPVGSWLVWPWRATGLLFLVFGLVLNVVADAQFKRHMTTVKPFEPSTTLVINGMFAASRHPMYLGMAVALLGVALLLGSFMPMVVIPVFVWWIQTRFVVPEEKSLTEQFGQAYLEYQSRVRRWI